MTTWATPYQPAYPPCSGSAQPGTIALSMVIDGLAPETTNLGIYNCRSVGGTSTQSIHSDGRAWDCGIPMLPGGRPNLALGNPILALLAANAIELGIQCVIWNDRIYSARNPNGSPYGGVSPHYDHLHIEQKWHEAQTLSVAEIAAILGDDQPGPPAPPSEEDDDMPRYIKIVGQPTDTNVYGYTDAEWWVASAEEVGSFGSPARSVNARQRDVIKSRVSSIGALRGRAPWAATAELDAAVRPIVRKEATDAGGRTNQAWLAGQANQEYTQAEVDAILAAGAAGGVLGPIYTALEIPEG